MARVVQRIELNDQEVRNAIVDAAKKLAPPDNGGGCQVKVEEIAGKEGGKELLAVVEFIKTAK